jgi:hypothetical protein
MLEGHTIGEDGDIGGLQIGANTRFDENISGVWASAFLLS